MTIHVPSESFQPAETQLQSSRRANGWSAAAQRTFLEKIAEGFGIETACSCVGLSTQSAYAFRHTAKGAAFALGWRAATLLARECVAEKLLVRALEGQVDTINRPDGTVITRHRFDNRLGMSLLARLDRQVEQAPDADVKAARLVAQEFDAFLDLVEHDAGPARAGLFLARRSIGGEGEAGDLAPIAALAAADRFLRTGVATAAEIDIADLDPARRADWSAEQWARAEAAGLIAFAPVPDEESPDEDDPTDQDRQHSAAGESGDFTDDDYQNASSYIRWDDLEQDWRTAFPPPEGFCGIENGVGDQYRRELTDAERVLVGPTPIDQLAELRDAYFALLAAERRADAAISPEESCREAGNTAPPSAPLAPPSSGSV